jgi:hypothetical protein
VARSVPDAEEPAELPDETVVVRGGEMDPDQTPEKARDEFDDKGVYGLSVWAVAGLSAIEIACYVKSFDDPDAQPPIRWLPHKKMRCSTVGQLQRFELWPRSPLGHYLLVLPNPPTDEDYAALQAAFSPPEDNPARQGP